MPDGYVVAKLDFCNAFNSLHRDLMLRSVLSTVPGIYRLCHLCYSNPSIIKFDDRTILSQEGPHQGNPLALSCSVSPSIRICCACNVSWWLT